MMIHVQNLVRMTEIVEPTLVITAVPPSDNKRKIRTKTGKFINLGVGTFKEHVDACILTDKVELPKPPVVVIFQIFFGDHRKRDPQNCIKALLDCLYPRGSNDDNEAFPWCMPPQVRKEWPHTRVWLIPISEDDKPFYLKD